MEILAYIGNNELLEF